MLTILEVKCLHELKSDQEINSYLYAREVVIHGSLKCYCVGKLQSTLHKILAPKFLEIVEILTKH